MRKIPFLFSLILLTSCKLAEAPALGLAKELCSCLFVVERDLKYCQTVTKESDLLADAKVLWEEKRVVASGLGFTAQASLQPEARFGCMIEAFDKKADEKGEGFSWRLGDPEV